MPIKKPVLGCEESALVARDHPEVLKDETVEQVAHVMYKAWVRDRTLKVREGYHSYQLKQEKADRTPVAEILLKGHWLIEAGFAIDTPVTVEVVQGKLIITPVS